MPWKIKKYFPYPTKDTLCTYYLPLGGAISYAAFSAHLLNPHDLARIFPNYWYPIAMGVWCNSHMGLGTYYYRRPHLRKIKDGSRMIYTIWMTVMFHFGSALFVRAFGDLLPRSKWLRAIFGMLSSISFLTIGYEYLQHLDNYVKAID